MELLVLLVFMVVLYGLVKGFAGGLAALTGARHRAYRAVARKYGGRYESRGLVDPPTVSFTHDGAGVRVGLAPVIPGQAATPRTRVVVRFAQGLPFRLELIPASRPQPPQPPKGTRPIRIGDPAFDRAHIIQANDPDIAREFLDSPDVQLALHSLRALAPGPSGAGMLLSVSPERLLVQVDRDLGKATPILDAAVRSALTLHDHLTRSVHSRVAQGIEVVAAGAAEPEDADGPPACKVCGVGIEGDHVVCASCRTPFHRDCWGFVGGCSTFGCTSKQCQPAASH
jgi:hypothetical protein